MDRSTQTLSSQLGVAALHVSTHFGQHLQRVSLARLGEVVHRENALIIRENFSRKTNHIVEEYILKFDNSAVQMEDDLMKHLKAHLTSGVKFRFVGVGAAQNLGSLAELGHVELVFSKGANGPGVDVQVHTLFSCHDNGLEPVFVVSGKWTSGLLSFGGR